MTHQDDRFDALLERSSEAIRNESLDPDQSRAIADRVWMRLNQQAATSATKPELIEGCDAFQCLMPEAARGALGDAQRLLLEDHLAACPRCRRAWARAKSGLAVIPGAARDTAASTRALTGWRPLAAAAAIALFAAGGVWVGRDLFGPALPTQANITEAPAGLIQLGGSKITPLAQGASLQYGETIRAPRDAGAVITLEDGSRVELRERTEMQLARRGRDTEIRLLRGDLIVEASKQGSGHLWVHTPDSEVAVVGTVFTVSSGLRGSRVSVLEGRVEVDTGGREHLLLPGDQVSSAAGSDRVPFASEVAWSHHRAKHIQLIAELQQLARDIDAIPAHPLRTSTELLDLMPAEIALFGSMPNLTDTLGEAHRLFVARLAQSPALQEWFSTEHGREVAAAIDSAVERVRTFGSQLGDEIVVGVAVARQREPRLLVASRLQNPEQFGAFIVAELERLDRERQAQGQHERLPVSWIEQISTVPATAQPGAPDALYLSRLGSTLVASNDTALLSELAARAQQPSTVRSRFVEVMANRYAGGVNWLAGADLETLFALASGNDETADQAARRSGVLDARHVVIESKSDRIEATIDFREPRHHLTAWLAEPATMGAVDYVSPNAYVAVSALVKDPVDMLHDIEEMADQPELGISQVISDTRQATGVDIRDDLLASLGGEFAFAIDGPVLPIPAWKVVIEVYDPARLQAALERLVVALNQRLTAEGRPGVAIQASEVQGYKLYSVQYAQDAVSVHYTFDGGYWLLASQQPVLLQAIQDRRSGLSLTRSSIFSSQLPNDGRGDLSAFVYSNLGPLMQKLSSASEAMPLDAAERERLAAIFGNTEPTLHWAYAGTDSITVGARGPRLADSLVLSMLGAGPAISAETTVGE
jgi:ferric-dicitrate binding protein FerR (iron transport regulator)